MSPLPTPPTLTGFGRPFSLFFSLSFFPCMPVCSFPREKKHGGNKTWKQKEPGRRRREEGDTHPPSTGYLPPLSPSTHMLDNFEPIHPPLTKPPSASGVFVFKSRLLLRDQTPIVASQLTSQRITCVHHTQQSAFPPHTTMPPTPLLPFLVGIQPFSVLERLWKKTA